MSLAETTFKYNTTLTKEYLLELINKADSVYKKTFRTWVEDFKDEETGEIIPFERKEEISVEQTCSDSEKESIVDLLYNGIIEGAQLLSSFELDEADYQLRTLGIDNKRYINFLEICSRLGFYNMTASLADIYVDGLETDHIYRNRQLAIKYQNLANEQRILSGVEPISSSLDPDVHSDYDYPDPYLVKMQIIGAQEQLIAIEQMISELCGRYGTPENECGMFIPLGKLMQELVGSKDYVGNVMALEHVDDGLLFTMEAEHDCTDAPMYAFRDKFKGVRVEIVSCESLL